MMKTIGTFLLLALLPYWAISQIRFAVEVKGLEKDFISIEKPYNGSYFPATPEKIYQGKKGRFIIETGDDQPGFVKIDFGNGKTTRVFLEKGSTNSLTVDLDNFGRSLNFKGSKAAQNKFLNELQREPLLPAGNDLIAARSINEMEVKPKDYYLYILDNVEAEKKILEKKAKKKFSEVFMDAVIQDITFYYISVFSEVVSNDYRAYAKSQPSRFTSKWAHYWSKIYEMMPATSEVIYSPYYLTALDFYYGDFRLGYSGEAIYADPDLVIGEQYLEYDRLMWEDIKGQQLEYTLAAIFSKRAILGNKEPILFDLFQKYKNDFPSSPYLELFENAVAEIGESLKEETFKFPEGMVQLDAEEEINSIEDIMKKFEGKVVYLDIWATWCSPCLFEFRQKKPLEEFVEGKDIVLVFVSVDNEDRREKWQKIIIDNDLKGYHVLANFSLRDELIDQFGDGSNLALPHYIIYDKKGKLADRNAKQPSHNSVLFNDLLRYVD